MIALILGACTKDFTSENTNPYQISNASLQQDFNNVGSYYPAMMAQNNAGFYGDQISENLTYESFTRHMASASDFASNINNCTYYITWNSYWGDIYGDVMPKSQQVLKIARPTYPVFTEWAELLRVMAISKLTAVYGPVIYSDYGSTATTVHYDKESDIYNRLFAELDTINTVFSANTSYTGITNFDQVYKGNLAQWIKFANSMRLRLAIRICEVNPTLAQAQATKAIQDPGGLILTNADNCNIPLYGAILPLARICYQWTDTQMDAAQESFLIGLNDGRLPQLFAKCDPSIDVSDHPAFQYKGTRNALAPIDVPGGAFGKGIRASKFSFVNASFNTVTSRRYMTAAEVNFDLAEAALRGWPVSGSAKSYYEAGITQSFADWGASGLSSYLADNTSTPIDYRDPLVSPVNDFKSRSTITVAWNEGDSNELKLEKIITQKWIDCFTNTLESWCDMRRTGYPKVPVNYINDSALPYGVIPKGAFIQRMPFVQGEITGNPAGVTEASTFLPGGNFIGSPLYFVPANAVNTGTGGTGDTNSSAGISWTNF